MACQCFVDSSGLWSNALILPFNKLNDINNNPYLQVDSYLHNKAYGIYNYRMVNDNVFLDNSVLNMRVSANIKNNEVLGSQVSTWQHNIKYGTFRAEIQLPEYIKNSSTCMGFFMYGNEEIDMEYLSGVPDKFYVSTRINNYTKNDVIYDSKIQVTNLYSNYQNFRFDWFPDFTTFYINDKQISKLKSPSRYGRIIFEHWANGDIYWSGLPSVDTFVKIKKLVMFYNTTNPNNNCTVKCDTLTLNTDRIYSSLDNTQDIPPNDSPHFPTNNIITEGSGSNMQGSNAMTLKYRVMCVIMIICNTLLMN
jgi:hypothetical protein